MVCVMTKKKINMIPAKKKKTVLSKSRNNYPKINMGTTETSNIQSP